MSNVAKQQSNAVGQAEFFVDAGQSAVKIRSKSASGLQTMSLSRVDTSKTIAPQIAFAVSQFSEQTGLSPWRITVSSTALSDPLATAREVMRELKGVGLESILMAHDSIGGYLSALGSAFGAVAAVGTGVVTLGVGPAGFARVDGWGNMIGDAGSGYWIGRAALDSAMRAHDGRGRETALLGMMREVFPDVESAYIQLQADPDRIFRVASFAKPVIELSTRDVVAAQIVEEACKEVALSISAALRRVGFQAQDEPEISWTGSVATNPIFSSRLESLVMSDWPKARLRLAEGEPLDGVQLMSELDSQHPLAAEILRFDAASLQHPSK